jgi:endonuclease/exonuclease/phosphatase (EEP) superfamily protein YafD
VTATEGANRWSIRAVIRWFAIGAAWAAVLFGLVFTIPTVLGATPHRAYAALQMVRPWLGIVAAVPLLVAVGYRRPLLALASGLCVVVNVVPIWAAVTHVETAAGSEEAVSLYVANLRFNNQQAEAQVDQALSSGADVLVLVELTPRYVELMRAAGADEAYPYQVRLPETSPSGEGIYSRLPLLDTGELRFGETNSPMASVRFGTGSLRIVALHTYAPNTRWGLDRWQQSLTELARYMDDDGLGPTVVAGDYNAARWHPKMADVLGTPFEDAHELAGKGLSPSWPAGGSTTGRVFRPIGPFVRLDHALVLDAGVVDVVDLPAVGTDHLPFVVTVVPEPT